MYIYILRIVLTCYNKVIVTAAAAAAAASCRYNELSLCSYQHFINQQGGFSVVEDEAIRIIDKWLLVKETSIIKLKVFSSAVVLQVSMATARCWSEFAEEIQSWRFNFLIAEDSTLWASEQPWAISCVFIRALLEMHFAVRCREGLF